MINKNYIHLLNYFASKNLLAGESKLVFKNAPGDFDIVPPKLKAKETREKRKEKTAKLLAIQAKRTEGYGEAFDKFPKKTVSIKTPDRISSVQQFIYTFTKKLTSQTSINVRKSKAFKDYIANLYVDIKFALKTNRNTLANNFPFTMSLEKGGMLRFKTAKGEFLKVDLKKESVSLKVLKSLRENYKKLREKKNQRKQEIVKKTKGNKQKLHTDFQKGLKDNPTANFDQLVSGKYLKKKGKSYTVNFMKKGKLDKKAEKSVQIQDLFDLSKLKGGNIHISFLVTGVSPAGNKFKHVAIYHKGAGTFFIKDSTRRVRIYHNTVISNITYKAGEYKPAGAKVAPKAKPQLKTKPKSKSETISEKERLRRAKEDLTDMYYGYVFQNAKFKVPKNIQDDKHFENINIWKKVSRYMGPILEGPPFGLTSPQQRREYIQEIIQKQLNENLYAEDFFKIKLGGERDLYKGGYKKFLKDYYRVEKEISWNNIDVDNPKDASEKAIIVQWNQLTNIASGIARVFEAFNNLKSPEVFKIHKETRTDVYRPLILGVEKAEKEPKGTKYHNLESLLHKKDKAPKELIIGVTNTMLAKIKQQFYKYEIPGFNPSNLLQSKGGLKLLFMAFGFRKLLTEKCLKKVDGNKLVLVKLPKGGWMEALATIQQTKAKLWDHSKDDFKKWEKVRAALSSGQKSRLFIRSIFTPTGSVVKENFNWWQGMCHAKGVWNKDRKISMAYLGTITVNPTHFEKFMAQDRGYLDMMEKTSKRIEGTSIYQPQESEVLKKTNQYIDYGLLSVLMNASDQTFIPVVNNLFKKLKIEKYFGMDENTFFNKDKLEILNLFYKALKFNNIEPGQLEGKKELIKLIKVGFILGRRVETSKKWAEVMNKNLSTRPMERKAQLDALKNGCPICLLKAVAQKVTLAAAAVSSGEIPANARTQRYGAGVLVSVKLFEVDGQPQYFTMGVFGSQGKTLQERCIPVIGLNGAIKAGKKITFRWMVGASTTFAGAAIGIETPIGKSDYNFYASIHAGVDYKGKRAGGGASIGVRFDRERSEKRQVKENMETRNIEDIDTAIKSNLQDKAASMILKHATFGKLMNKIKERFKIDSATIVDIYLQSRKDWVNYAKRNMKVPWFLGAGLSGYGGVDLKSGKPISVGGGAYFTFKIPGTEVNYVIRHENAQYSGYMQTRAAAFDLRKKLKENGVNNYKIAPYIIKAGSGLLRFDSRLGRSGVARPKGGFEAPTPAMKTGEKTVTFKSTFELVKKTFLKLDIHVEKIKDPKNKKGFLLALTPLQTERSNLEILMDPEMKSRGLILDKANNRFLIAASAAKDLHITRTTYRYPFRKEGAMNFHVITFKSNPDRNDIQIKKESPWSLYKFRGEKYERAKNEAMGKSHYNVNIVNGSPVVTRKPSNVMTFAEFKNSKRKLETFNDYKAEYTKEGAQRMTGKLWKAMDYKEVEPVRTEKLQLAKFGTWLYKIKSLSLEFDKGVGGLKTPEQENLFKTKWFGKIATQYKKFAKLNGLKGLSINEQEKNLIYAYLLDKSFTRLLKKKRPNPKVIDRRLELRNGLFKRYMRKYINKYIANNPAQWKEILKNNPGASKEGVLRYLTLCMPQNYKMLQRFLKSKQDVPFKEGMKYASYTHRFGTLEAMPSAFGVDAPAFKNILKLIKPTKLNVKSLNADERVSANLILRMMSPLSTKNIDKLDGKKKFLRSELSQLLLSMYDKKTNISPLIQVLGKAKFKGLTQIINKLKTNPAEALKTHADAFEDFKTIVLGIREAQLAGKATFTFKNKYVFHVGLTEIYAGPYLKCGNGTVAVNQQIGISIKGAKKGRISGARTDMNIRVGVTEKKAYAQFNFLGGAGHKFKGRKRPTPPRKDTPQKTPVQAKPKPTETTGGGSAANPAPDTAVQPGNTSSGTGDN